MTDALGPQFTQAHAHPDSMSDEALHEHLVEHHDYTHHEILGSGSATGLEGRAALLDLHNFSHANTDYSLDVPSAESPWPGADVPHHHPGWRRGQTNSFNAQGVHMDTGIQAQVRRR